MVPGFPSGDRGNWDTNRGDTNRGVTSAMHMFCEKRLGKTNAEMSSFSGTGRSTNSIA